jgi:hypothetical protein
MYFVNLNKGSLTDIQIIKQIFSAIRCVKIRSNIIDEHEQVEAGERKL